MRTQPWRISKDRQLGSFQVRSLPNLHGMLGVPISDRSMTAHQATFTSTTLSHGGSNNHTDCGQAKALDGEVRYPRCMKAAASAVLPPTDCYRVLPGYGPTNHSADLALLKDHYPCGSVSCIKPGDTTLISWLRLAA